jgi:ubiquitin-like protein Pup
VDAILDEIDEVLEENAEEFVRSYVQLNALLGRLRRETLLILQPGSRVGHAADRRGYR